ncbi:hypothetical protein STCU_10347 [Strigomonas culicis]|uniref:Uncharacterized protein n=1 Tax=Strigomonas culicis TaxID=28005 RepID=S9TM84_9TRYP|nr:hypothetical protein STCU_10347 [Strigomonas culicis]|eukprot:EPY17899.1 hypothetical protein STCU_10347 [Strigomonas culicis]
MRCRDVCLLHLIHGHFFSFIHLSACIRFLHLFLSFSLFLLLSSSLQLVCSIIFFSTFVCLQFTIYTSYGKKIYPRKRQAR